MHALILGLTLLASTGVDATQPDPTAPARPPVQVQPFPGPDGQPFPGGPPGFPGPRGHALAQQHKTLMPALLEALKDTDAEVRKSAGSALAKMAPDSVKPLIELAKGKDKTARIAAIRALGEMGWDAQEAVPTILTAMKDEDVEIRRSAAASLNQLMETTMYGNIGGPIFGGGIGRPPLPPAGGVPGNPGGAPPGAAPGADPANPPPAVKPVRPIKIQPIQIKPIKARPIQIKPVEKKPIEDKPVEDK